MLVQKRLDEAYAAVASDGTEKIIQLEQEVDRLLQPLVDAGFSKVFVNFVGWPDLIQTPATEVMEYFSCRGGVALLSKFRLNKRLRAHYNYIFIELLNGTTIRIDSQVASQLSQWNEADWLLFNYLIDNRLLSSESAQRLAEVITHDALPVAIKPQNYALWLQMYSQRRYFLLHDIGVPKDWQTEFLLEEIQNGSRGIVEAQVSRLVGAAIGKGLHNAIRPARELAVPAPEVFQEIVAIIDDHLNSIWEKTINARALRDYHRLFHLEGSPLATAEILTAQLMGWWLIKTTFAKVLNAGELFLEDDQVFSEISDWFTKVTSLPVTAVTTNFLPHSLAELSEKINQYLYGRLDSLPGADNMTIDYDYRFGDQTAADLEHRVLDIVVQFLWEQYPRLVRTTMEGLVALTRLSNENPLVEKVLNAEDQVWQVFSEINLPGEGGRCDFLLVPADCTTTKLTQGFWESLTNRRVILVEVKTDDKALSQGPAEAHTAQIKGYVDSILEVNSCIQVEPYLLQVTVFGSRLIPMTHYIENFQPRTKRKAEESFEDVPF